MVMVMVMVVVMVMVAKKVGAYESNPPQITHMLVCAMLKGEEMILHTHTHTNTHTQTDERGHNTSHTTDSTILGKICAVDGVLHTVSAVPKQRHWHQCCVVLCGAA
jgi:hypothetical protein